MKRQIENDSNNLCEAQSKARRLITDITGTWPAATKEPKASHEVCSPFKVFQDIPKPEVFPGRSQNSRKRSQGSYKINTVNTIRALIEEIQLEKPKEKVKLRFLLTTNFELLFAREGSPSNVHNIPGHYQMTGQELLAAKCLSAGNIVFDSKLQITKINNKSGDFRPSFNSLQSVLAVIEACELNYSSQVELEESLKSSYTVNSGDLKAFIENRFKPEQLENYKKINLLLDPMTHHYKSTLTKYSLNKGMSYEDTASPLPQDKVLRKAVEKSQEMINGGDHDIEFFQNIQTISKNQ